MTKAHKVYGKSYHILIRKAQVRTSSAPRLVVVGFQPNETAREILRLCIDSLRRFTPEEHELWVVDNCSPPHLSQWLRDEPGLNVIFNLTPPCPPRPYSQLLNPYWTAPYAGSYANAVALELAARIIDPATELLMTLHMDTMACRSGWLSFLRSKLDDEVRCVGVRMDRARSEVVHVLGMLFDFTLFRPLRLTFAHDMPRHDVGDGISLKLKEAGYRLWACRNTLPQPELIDLLPAGSPYRTLSVDRAFDDDNDIIFMHLGRGVWRSRLHGGETQVTPAEWLRFGSEVVLATRRHDKICGPLRSADGN